MFESHCKSVRRVIEALTEAGFQINCKKCKFLMKKLKFMGHLIDGNSHSIDSHKMKVAAKIAHPVTGKQVEQMLGFFNFLRDFISNFASIAAPLKKLRKLKKITSTWREAEEKAFQDLKYVVEHVLVLSQPDWELEFWVACDASQNTVGAVLYQVTEDGLKKYVMLCSKTLQAGQQNYPAPKRELLAIVFSLKKFRYYLLGRKFVVETDHKALMYLNSSTLFIILDWLDFLLQYDFTIVFIKGMENVLPDFLSCCCVKEEVPVEYELPLVGLDVRNVDCDSEPGVYTKERLEEFLNSVIDKCEPIDKDKLSLVQDKHNESHMGVSGTFNNLFCSGYY